MQRYLTFGSYILLLVAVIGFENKGMFAGPVLAAIGIGVVLSFIASPIMVFLSAQGYMQNGKSAADLAALLFSVGYLAVAAFIVIKLWPQLMTI
ncbi:MAG: hypothetical protein JXR18_01370 [Neptuniibacter sp.]